MIHNICYFNQKINELRLRGKTAKDVSKYMQKLITLPQWQEISTERDGWKLSTNEVLAIATTINNMKDDTTESSAKTCNPKHKLQEPDLIDQFLAIPRLHKGMQKNLTLRETTAIETAPDATETTVVVAAVEAAEDPAPTRNTKSSTQSLLNSNSKSTMN